MLLCSCGKAIPDGNNGQTVILDWPGYIWFDADAHATKTTAVTSMGGKTFNVIAFKYGSDWNTFKATGTPASAMSSSEPYGFAFPTTVSCSSDGVCSYTNVHGDSPVECDGTMKYSFFAWYPASAADPASTVTLETNANSAGVPSIKYTVPAAESDGYMNASKLPDVLTASTTDAQNTGAGVVALNFKHALCLLTVEARNLKEGTVADISNLIMTISSQRYGNISIPLDGSATTPGGRVTNNFNCRMQPSSGTGSSVSVPEFGIDGSSANTMVSHHDYSIAFIPQGNELGDLEGELKFDVTFHKDGEADVVKTGLTQEFSSNKAFQAGKKYAFVITIAADDSISIAIIESGEWETESTDIIFE